MTTILHIASSSNTASSFTRQIGSLTVEELKKVNPNAKIIERDLVKNPLPHLSPEWLGAAFSGQHNAPILSDSRTLIDELFASDIIVLEAPMYNFGIPSALKAWIDHVIRAGKTFQYGANGPEGLVKGKKLYLVVSSGGVYSQGPMKTYEHQGSYLRSVLGFIGITDIETIAIEGVAMGSEKIAQAIDAAKIRAHTITQAAAA